MDLNYLEKILRIFDQSSLTDLTIEEEGIKISLSKKNSIIENYTSATSAPPTALQSVPSPTNVQPTFVEKDSKAEKEISTITSIYHKIVSPIVGTFYRSPSPDSEPFVKVGSRVVPGQTVCIVEAMKVMNEIESDISGIIVEILVENGKPVEYNQTLMLIKPD